MNWEVFQQAILIVFQTPLLWLLSVVAALNLLLVAGLIFFIALRPLLKNFGG